MNTRFIGALFLVPVLIASCSGGSSDPFNRIESTYTGMVDALCHSCPAIAGTSEAECRTMATTNNPFTGGRWDCQRNAYHMYPNELGPYYDCVANAVSTYDGCMRTAAATCPPASSATQACGNQLTANIQACHPPDSIMASQALQACFATP